MELTPYILGVFSFWSRGLIALIQELWHFQYMNRIWRHLSSVMTIALLTSTATTSLAVAEAIAADLRVNVRGNDHEDYTRLVFEGATATPEYEIKQETIQGKQTAKILFMEAVSLDISSPPPESLPRITGYNVGRQSVTIDYEDGIKLSHFTLGKKLILDFKGAAKTKPKVTAKTEAIESKHPVKEAVKEIKKEEEAPTELTKAIASDKPEKKEHVESSEKEKNVSEQVEKIEKEVSTNDALQKHVVVDDGKPNTAPHAEEKKSPPEIKLVPHSINVAGTTAFALAVFEKGEDLWFVIDKPDVAVPPQYEGPNSAKFDGFRRFTTGDATVFRTKRPKDYTLSAKGGGLVWEVKLTGPTEGKFEPVPIGREEKDIGGDGPSLEWPSYTLHRTTRITDPDTGETIWIGLVNSPQDFSGKAQRFAEMESLTSVIGLAVLSKVDDLTVLAVDNKAIITRPEGLALSMKKDLLPYKSKEREEDGDGNKDGGGRVFNFEEWLGGDSMDDLYENQRLILSGLQEQTELKKSEGMLFLGRMMLSHGFAPEAKGFFDLAEVYTPELSNNTEYKALRGASEMMSGHFTPAFQNLNNPILDKIDEVRIWKAAALSGLDDWQQAAKTLPENLELINTYPNAIFYPIALRTAEIALREGNRRKAEKILEMIDERKKDGESMALAYASSFQYLNGELDRQKGDIESAKIHWSELETGKDDLYRAKSRLAMATLRYGEKEITIDKAIDSLEGLRYAWRGDELETSINYNLGKLYLEKGEPVKALGLMRMASSLIPNSEMGKTINQVMHATFRDLYMTDKIQDLSPLEALTMYDEFAELVPEGAEGDRLARQLAERLADVDLLPRAINLLKNQVDNRLSGLEGGTVAIRLASMQVLDNKAVDALTSLEKATEFLKDIPTEEAEPKRRQIALLKAKAYSLMNKPQESFAALNVLSQDEDVLRLRADIAWKSKRWQEAADSLEQLVARQEISLTRPLTEVQAKLVMDWAVALYLADNRYVLANLRERFSTLMGQTSRAREFEVITRPRQNILLADRDTIKGIIGETDMFRDFLDSLKEDLTGPVTNKETNKATNKTAGSSPSSKTPTNLPESLKETPPQIQIDEVLAD